MFLINNPFASEAVYTRNLFFDRLVKIHSDSVGIHSSVGFLSSDDKYFKGCFHHQLNTKYMFYVNVW